MERWTEEWEEAWLEGEKYGKEEMLENVKYIILQLAVDTLFDKFTYKVIIDSLNRLDKDLKIEDVI